jgi:hypothetical protein
VRRANKPFRTFPFRTDLPRTFQMALSIPETVLAVADFIKKNNESDVDVCHDITFYGNNVNCNKIKEVTLCCENGIVDIELPFVLTSELLNQIFQACNSIAVCTDKWIWPNDDCDEILEVYSSYLCHDQNEEDKDDAKVDERLQREVHLK